jgi:hypothetical protein
MIGAIVLFQITVAATPASDASRPVVSSEPIDLSTLASQIHINRKALEGWVPRKGTPVPPAELPQIVSLPSPPEKPRNASREDARADASADSGETVNSFDQTRPYFFGSRGARRPHPGVGHAHRRGPAGGAPGRMTRGMDRRGRRSQ